MMVTKTMSKFICTNHDEVHKSEIDSHRCRRYFACMHAIKVKMVMGKDFGHAILDAVIINAPIIVLTSILFLMKTK